MIDQAQPYRKEMTTLRKLAKDPMFAKGWFVKVVDGGDPFVIPLEMFFNQQYKSEHDPDLDLERTAFFTPDEQVVLLVTGYVNLPVITLLNWTQALSYSK